MAGGDSVTAEERTRLKQAIDAHKRQERAHILAMAKGVGRCKECGTLLNDCLPGCGTCRDRARVRRKRAA